MCWLLCQLPICLLCRSPIRSLLRRLDFQRIHTLFIDAYLMQKWAVAGQRLDTELDSIQRLILFIKVARKHGGVVLDSNILNLAIHLEYFKGVKGR